MSLDYGSFIKEINFLFLNLGFSNYGGMSQFECRQFDNRKITCLVTRTTSYL